jgi:hypothetical protein
MPPRYAYWTILIDQKPTAFRAKEKDELLPTLHQLQRKNPDVVMKWFARGRLWDSPEQALWSDRNLPKARERRGRDWRPGGDHKDPRARFDKPKRDRRPPAGAPPAVKPFGDRVGTPQVLEAPRPLPTRPRGPWKPRPFENRPPPLPPGSDKRPRFDPRPKPGGQRTQNKPFSDRQHGGERARPFGKPAAGKLRGGRRPDRGPRKNRG